MSRSTKSLDWRKVYKDRQTVYIRALIDVMSWLTKSLEQQKVYIDRQNVYIHSSTECLLRSTNCLHRPTKCLPKSRLSKSHDRWRFYLDQRKVEIDGKPWTTKSLHRLTKCLHTCIDRRNVSIDEKPWTTKSLHRSTKCLHTCIARRDVEIDEKSTKIDEKSRSSRPQLEWIVSLNCQWLCWRETLAEESNFTWKGSGWSRNCLVKCKRKTGDRSYKTILRVDSFSFTFKDTAHTVLSQNLSEQLSLICRSALAINW
jgi:hypothetical protein